MTSRLCGEPIRDWVKDAGYQVATAESGEEAMEMIQKQDFSVVVLDVRLPRKPRLKEANI